MWRSFFSAGSSAVRAASFVPTKSIPVVTKQIYAVPSTMTRYFSSSGNEDGPTIQDLANSLDLTLTPEQRLYVDKIKKSIRGGAKSPRSLYREVPTPDEITGLGNFMPKYADNAEELIDYALSHLPEKAGKRQSRKQKRDYLKWETKRKWDAVKKEQLFQKNLKRHQKLKRIRMEVKAIQEEAAEINKLREMKLRLKAESNKI